MRWFVIVLALAGLWPAAGIAEGEPAAPAKPERGEPPAFQAKQRPKNAMRFEWVREGPADACGNNCREWVSARGTIMPDTGRDFEEFARARDPSGQVMVLQSPGGAVAAGLALGRALRRFNMTVVVGHTEMLPPESPDDESRAKYSPRAVCASMCPFVLLGGARRHVPREARIAVHQIWPGATRADSTAAAYSAQAVAALLRGTAEIARYTVDMGGEIELFDLTMRIPPWESLRTLTQAEILRTRLSTTDTPFAASVTATASASSPPGVVPSLDGKPIPMTQWVLGGTGPELGIVRRHPLTIYGEEIGTFVLTIACGDQPDRLTMRYWETRRLANADGKEAVTRALVGLGPQRFPLAVESSRVTGGRLESTARGPVSVASIVALVTDAQRTLAVATLTDAKVQTIIHVGTTGLRAALPRLAKECPR